VIVPDPVGAGFVNSLARPDRNASGFLMFEYGIGGKSLELLKQITSAVTQVAVIRDPAITAGIGQWGAAQTAAAAFGVEVSPVGISNASEIERGITTFARGSNRGLIVRSIDDIKPILRHGSTRCRPWHSSTRR